MVITPTLRGYKGRYGRLVLRAPTRRQIFKRFTRLIAAHPELLREAR